MGFKIGSILLSNFKFCKRSRNTGDVDDFNLFEEKFGKLNISTCLKDDAFKFSRIFFSKDEDKKIYAFKLMNQLINLINSCCAPPTPQLLFDSVNEL